MSTEDGASRPKYKYTVSKDYCNHDFSQKSRKNLYKIATFSETSNTVNQDRIWTDCRKDYTLLVAADGAGGTGCGDLAAQDVIDYVANTTVLQDDISIVLCGFAEV